MLSRHKSQLLTRVKEEQITFHNAAKQGKTSLVSLFILNRLTDINEPLRQPGHADDGKTALYLAIENGHSKIVDILLSNGAVYSPITSMNLSLLHLAVLSDRLSVVQVVYHHCKSNLNVTDYLKQTPLFIAVMRQKVKIVEYLLQQEGVDLSIVAEYPDHWIHNMTALGLAFKLGNEEIIGCFLQKYLDLGYLDASFETDSIANQVANFIASHPMFLPLVTMHPNLIRLFDSDDEGHLIRYQGATRRSPSFFSDIDLETREVVVYKPSQLLKENLFDNLRQFVGPSGKHVLVKSCNAKVTNEQSYSELSFRMYHDASFFQQVYPEVRIQNISTWREMESDGSQVDKGRLVINGIEGETLEHLLNSIDSRATWGELVLEMVRTLKELHHKNIVHGDITPKNIIAQKVDERWRVHYINFESSTSADEALTNRSHRSPILPEYVVKVNSNFNFDVYLFAVMLKDICSSQLNLSEFTNEYDSIVCFINEAVSRWSRQCPSLMEFHSELLSEHESKQLEGADHTDSECALWI